MPNDFLSLWPSPRLSARSVEGTTKLLRKMPLAVLALLAVAALPACGGEEDNSVTYDDDVKSIFNLRCTTCHHAGSPIQVDIENPYSPTVGLVNSVNSWAVEYPGESDAMNVVPFDPDASFLMDKITDNLAANGHGGESMPWQIAPVTEEELEVLTTWVTDGAQPGPVFDNQVRPIFGTPDRISGKCIFCHYSGSPNPLDLSDPFGPDGLVDVEATYRGNMKRVVPGDPENSLMILKVRAENASSDIGAQMPYSFDALTERQVGIVRQWIVEGARP